MKPVAYITTSWDDGHPLDVRVAELLAKYDLAGTFYVPKTSEFGTMRTDQVRELSRSFEIGGHTIHHVVLSGTSDRQASQEIAGSKSWLEDHTGLPCSMFCPPKGRSSKRHLDLIRQAGYSGVRSVELLSLDLPRSESGLFILPTTVQAHPRGFAGYFRNMARRAAFRNMWLYFLRGRSTDWLTLSRSYLNYVVAHGGVFHLWGHSWELESTGQWRRLEDAFRLISEFTQHAPAVSNGQLCQAIGDAECIDRPVGGENRLAGNRGPDR